MVYYFACSYPLENGSVVKKGNWGRICRKQPLKSANLQMLLKELVFENVRVLNFPDRPSRLECLFLFPNLESYNNFSTTIKRPFDIGYVVEIIEPEQKQFETGWNLVSVDYTNIQNIEQRACIYWNPTDVGDEFKEVLTESDVKIIQRI